MAAKKIQKKLALPLACIKLGARLNIQRIQTMNAAAIVSNLQSRKGQFVSITWQRDAHTRKDYDGKPIAKRTTATVRAGINYANLASVKDAIESGEREEVGPLPWGAWRVGAENLIIDHKGKEYVRLYAVPTAKPSVQWLLDGKAVDFSAVSAYLLASEKPKDEEDKSPCFNVNAADVVSIG